MQAFMVLDKLLRVLSLDPQAAENKRASGLKMSF